MALVEPKKVWRRRVDCRSKGGENVFNEEDTCFVMPRNSSQPPEKRWSGDQKKRGLLIRRALRMTKRPMTEIAQRAEVTYNTVRHINILDEIRDAETNQRILSSTARQRHARQERCLFDEKAKERLLTENKGLILKPLRRAWGFSLIRQRFGTFETLLQECIARVKRELDYYDPARKGKKGKTQSVTSFIYANAHFFCLNAWKNEKTKYVRQWPVGIDGKETQFSFERTPKAFPVLTPEAIRIRAKRFPIALRHFLKKVGILPVLLIELGSERVKKQVLAFAKKASLTPAEKKIIELRLDGHSQRTVGEQVQLSYERVRQLEDRAIRKIRLANAPSIG